MAKEKILNRLKSHILVFTRKVLKISILTIPFGVGGFYVKKKKALYRTKHTERSSSLVLEV